MARPFTALPDSLLAFDACTAEHIAKWVRVKSERKYYADGLAAIKTIERRPWSEEIAAEKQRLTVLVEEARAIYLEAVEEWKSSWRELKTAHRELLQNKVL